MRCLALSLQTCACVMAIMAMSSLEAKASLITAGGNIVFDSNGFEGSSFTVGSVPATNSPTVGTWWSADPVPQTVVDSLAYAGSRSLSVNDPSGLLNTEMIFAGGAVDPATTDLSAEFLYQTTAQYRTELAVAFCDGSGTDGSTANKLTRLLIGDNDSDTSVKLFDVTEAAGGLGLTFNGGEWNKVVMNWDHATLTATVSLNDSAPVSIGYYSASMPASIDRLRFYSGWANGIVGNLDTSAAIPEPSTLVLSAMGLIGLLAYAWRKRK